MASGPDDQRNDHTRPTIAFIALAVAAAAVMTAGMTSRAETSIAGDLPPRVTAVEPTPSPAAPTPQPLAVPDFAMADVVTLAAAEATLRPRSEARPDHPSVDADGLPETGVARPAPAADGAGTGSRAGSSGPRGGSGAGPRGGSDGSGSGTRTKNGSGGSATTGRDGGGDAGPGRSTTGRGKARGQRDATPGRATTGRGKAQAQRAGGPGRGARKVARTTSGGDTPGNGRAEGRR